MADKLRIYKGALRLLGPHELATLADDRPERYQLDDAWDDAVEHLLNQGLWNFAIRAVQLSADDDVAPLFGWDYGFSQPDDYIRTVGISDEPTFRNGFENYEIEAGKWFANIDTLYLRYVSNDAQYGLNIGSWTQAFAKCLEAYLAFETGLPVSGDRGNRNDLFSLYEKRLTRAKTLDAFDESVKYSPQGRFVRARFSRRYGRDA